MVLFLSACCIFWSGSLSLRHVYADKTDLLKSKLEAGIRVKR